MYAPVKPARTQQPIRIPTQFENQSRPCFFTGRNYNAINTRMNVEVGNAYVFASGPRNLMPVSPTNCLFLLFSVHWWSCRHIVFFVFKALAICYGCRPSLPPEGYVMKPLAVCSNIDSIFFELPAFQFPFADCRGPNWMLSAVAVFNQSTTVKNVSSENIYNWCRCCYYSFECWKFTLSHLHVHVSPIKWSFVFPDTFWSETNRSRFDFRDYPPIEIEG